MFHLKICFNKTIHRHALGSVPNILELRKLVSDMFNVEDFKLFYIDDENDTVSLTSDEDVQEAFFVLENSSLTTLKIIVRSTRPSAAKTDGEEKNEQELPSREELIQKLLEIYGTDEEFRREVPIAVQTFVSSRMAQRSLKQCVNDVLEACGAIRENTFIRSLNIDRNYETLFQRMTRDFAGILPFMMGPAAGNLPGDNTEAESESVHYGVTCDGCDVAPIVGARHKCAQCDDYDLCPKCYESGVHSEHLMDAIERPLRNPGFRGGFRGRGRGRGRGGMRGCGAASPELFFEGKAFQEVFGRFAEHFAKISSANATFVRDVTIPDESVLSSENRSVIIKTWEIKNSGTTDWDADTKLRFIGGDNQLLVQNEFDVPLAKVGESVEVSAVISVPEGEGKYRLEFQLVSGAGVPFGDQMWCIFSTV